MSTAVNADTILQDRSITHLAPILRSMQRNSIRLFPKSTAAEPEIGTSKLGGRPDLPTGIDWPTLAFQIPPRSAAFRAARPCLSVPHESGIQAMPFLGQLRCEDLAPFDLDRVLPSAGMLYFFFFDESYEIEVPPDYASEEGVGHDLVHGFYYTFVQPERHSRVRVIYSDQTDCLTRRDFPAHLPADPFSTRYRPCRLSFGREMTLPRGEDGWIGLGPWDRALHMFDEDVVRPYEGLFYEWRANKNNIHQMVGHPDMFSHGPDTPDDPFPEDAAEGQLPLKDYVMRVAKERGLSSLQVYSEIEPFLRNRQIRAARDRRLLLQIQSGIEPLTGMSFGRDVYVFIREQDLRRRDFTKVWWDMS